MRLISKKYAKSCKTGVFYAKNMQKSYFWRYMLKIFNNIVNFCVIPGGVIKKI